MTPLLWCLHILAAGNIILEILIASFILNHLILLKNYVPSLSQFCSLSFLSSILCHDRMRVYDHELSLSSSLVTEDQFSRRLISPSFLCGKYGNIEEDQKRCIENKKAVNSSARLSPRSTSKTKRSSVQNGTARATGNDTADTANSSSQRLDALTYFELHSSTAIESDPNLALWFTTESVKKAATALWREMQSSSAFLTYSANKEKPRKRKRKESIWPDELEFTFCQGKNR